MSNSNEYSGQSKLSRTGGEADKEIVGLRNALDEHLRNLDTPEPPLDTEKRTDPKKTNPIATGNKPKPSSFNRGGRRPFVVLLAAFLGLVFGAFFSSELGKSQRAMKSIATSQGTADEANNAVATPELNEERPAPATPPNTSPSENIEPVTAESATDSGSATETTPTVRWQACLDQASKDVEPPLPGETWWPVVGPSDSLDDSRRHCRNDAFINQSGNAQISSFRDRDTAVAFAEQLTQDTNNQWRFWVGDPSVR